MRSAWVLIGLGTTAIAALGGAGLLAAIRVSSKRRANEAKQVARPAYH
ncbi:hypothetical protein [Sphingomonas xinjiangensis]|uniref:Uncharacterized protein n=1 Tax=Sphingomonas xinjiangensis TaxID=643568 RepID=A0A840YH53_9SPHN|nr:hypothetical protein [Sphingomonas xinjiangensis]MBB5712214.1 hypothetical protein [Sphingomonas xinjiangensis]